MVCPTCGLDNDPRTSHCARCNTTLTPALTDPPPPAGHPPPPPAGHPLPPGPPRQRGRLPLIIGAAVLVLLTAIGVVVYTRTSQNPVVPPAQTQAAPARPATTATTGPAPSTAGPATSRGPAPAGDPRAQAAAIDAVLSDSVQSRRKLNTAIQQIDNCTGLRAAVTDITEVGAERQSQMDTVRNADVSALPGGESLRSGLIRALQYAWEADQGFLQWAEPTLTGGCGAADEAGYDRGRAASTRAGTAKRAFLADWNEVARANNLSTRSADDI